MRPVCGMHVHVVDERGAAVRSAALGWSVWRGNRRAVNHVDLDVVLEAAHGVEHLLDAARARRAST